MTFALAFAAARRFLGNIPAPVWYALAALALTFAVWHFGVRHGVAIERPRTAAALARLATSEANNRTLKAAIVQQNAATQALADAANAKIDAAHKATVKAQEAFAGTQATIDRLKRPTRPAGSVARPEPVSDEEANAWAKLSR